ncbi:ester cyclase [Pseudonocardia nigra]|uniref:ester cyclase n=1 Tax=Pseudonocardia nigra TaxID=1921578 RepID=UPI001C5FCA8A|nr:ester cyclase [Pseudonocardia nigra]
MPDYLGVIHDTIWTGDDASGYRTSMRWTATGTDAARGVPIVSSVIANCVVLGDRYVEEWAGANSKHGTDQLGIDPDTAATDLVASGPPPGGNAGRSAQEQGATVPAVPETVDGAGLFVVELLDGLYNRRDLDLVEKRYAPGAPYVFGASQRQAGHTGVRSEAGRWLDLLPDARLEVEELYWLDDGPARSRVAVRYRIRGTAQAAGGAAAPVSIMGIHHVHVRGDLVVAEWAEYDELALRAQVLRRG